MSSVESPRSQQISAKDGSCLILIPGNSWSCYNDADTSPWGWGITSDVCWFKKPLPGQWKHSSLMIRTLGGLAIFMRIHRKFPVFADAGDPFKKMPVKLVILSTYIPSPCSSFPTCYFVIQVILSTKTYQNQGTIAYLISPFGEAGKSSTQRCTSNVSLQVDRLGEAICSGAVAEMWQRMATLPPGHQWDLLR